MKHLNIIIERGADLYAAYSEKHPGLYAAADNVDDVKKNIHKAIKLYIKYNDDKLSNFLKSNITIKYTFDLESFFNYYNGVFTKSGLEKITGINQKQIQHYASGLKKPRLVQRKKIEYALHKLGDELKSISF